MGAAAAAAAAHLVLLESLPGIEALCALGAALRDALVRLVLHQVLWPVWVLHPAHAARPRTDGAHA
eukprot:2283486-Prymnesium_polylepis.2